MLRNNFVIHSVNTALKTYRKSLHLNAKDPFGLSSTAMHSDFSGKPGVLIPGDRLAPERKSLDSARGLMQGWVISCCNHLVVLFEVFQVVYFAQVSLFTCKA